MSNRDMSNANDLSNEDRQKGQAIFEGKYEMLDHYSRVVSSGFAVSDKRSSKES